MAGRICTRAQLYTSMHACLCLSIYIVRYWHLEFPKCQCQCLQVSKNGLGLNKKKKKGCREPLFLVTIFLRTGIKHEEWKNYLQKWLLKRRHLCAQILGVFGVGRGGHTPDSSQGLLNLALCSKDLWGAKDPHAKQMPYPCAHSSTKSSFWKLSSATRMCSDCV